MNKYYGMYIFSLVLFGCNGILASHIHLSSYEIVFLRALLGSAFLLCLFVLSKRQFTFWQNKKAFLFLIVSGAAMAASWMCLYEAYRQIGVGMATLLYYCGPVIIMALSPWLFAEKLSPLKVLGFVVVLAGVVLINGELAQGENALWGLFCGGLSACLYVVMVVFNKKAAPIGGMENAALQLAAGFLTLLAFMAFRQGLPISVAFGEWGWVLLLGLIHTGFGCYLYFSSMGHLPVQSVAICGYLEPLCAVLFSAVLLNEKMTLPQLLGGGMILGGALWSEMAGSFCAKNKVK